MTVAEARAKLVEAIDDLATSPEDTPFQRDIRDKAWQEVKKRIDFFENTIDDAAYEYGYRHGLRADDDER